MGDAVIARVKTIFEPSDLIEVRLQPPGGRESYMDDDKPGYSWGRILALYLGQDAQTLRFYGVLEVSCTEGVTGLVVGVPWPRIANIANVEHERHLMTERFVKRWLGAHDANRLQGLVIDARLALL